MDIRVLRYFLATAREESISGAAAALHMTQPTLSRQLMELEEELETKLFIRGNRKITLTDDGMLLRKRAEEILALVEKTENELHTSAESIEGDIYIGGGETDAIHLIAKIAHKLQQEHPQIRYHLFSGNADDVTEKLDKGLLDFGILIEPANISKYNFIRLPAEDTWGVLMPKSSPLSSKDSIEPEDLWDLPLITSRQSFVSNELSSWIKRTPESLNIAATYNLVYNASIMVDEGLGYALCLDKLINTSENSNLCFRPLHPPLRAHLDIVWKKYQLFSRAADIFLKRLQAEFSDISI